MSTPKHSLQLKLIEVKKYFIYRRRMQGEEIRRTEGGGRGKSQRNIKKKTCGISM